jgi:hypothetical protein
MNKLKQLSDDYDVTVDNMKVGDKVIVTKSIAGVFNQKAVIDGINETLKFYRVELTEGHTLSGGRTCNIFEISSLYWKSESIKLDLQETRNDKLKDLGI